MQEETANTTQELIETNEELVLYPNEIDLEYPQKAMMFENTNDEMEEEDLAFYPKDSDLEYPEDTYKLELDFMDDVQQEDKLWKARTGLNEDSICGAIETIVFMSDKPVALLKIKSLIDEDMPLRVIHEAIERLQSEYETTHHGLRLQEVAEGYQFRTKPTYSKYVQDLFKVNELVLSPTALEVLAIIAYKQPVSKVEVEKIRGVDSSHIVRGLMDKRLVRVAGRSEEVGKPVLYGTTQEFLEVFNLANTDQLPPEHELEEIATQGVGKISDIRTLVNADLQSRFSPDVLDELDQLSLSIKSIDSETPFTKSLKVEEKKRVRGENNEEVRTAFDLLEEYLDRSLVLDSNQMSAISEAFTAIISPEVIGDLTAGPFNIPEEEEIEEDFEMIDLDTGEVIREEDYDAFIDIELEDFDGDIEFELSEDDSYEVVEGSQTQVVLEQEIQEEIIEVLGNGEDEAQKLAAALDDAFAKLLGEESPLENTPLDASDIEDNIDEQTNKIVEDAKDLDLDLSFMNDNLNSDNTGDEYQ